MSRSEFLEESTAASVVAKARTFMTGDAQFFSSQPNFDQIRKQLDSDSISSKKEAMKRIVAQIALGNNMSVLFPEVVKNIHAASIELRKLIYYFIIHYSEERPNEALLSISAFQHDLLDSSMHVRALALRTLSSIRIAAINPVVLVAIKKASTDLAPLVRRTAALAITKANKIAKGEDNTAQLIPIIQQLLGDRSMDVVGAAASTFLQLCPTRFDLVHKHFRRICRNIMECDEWGQVQLLHLLLRYARNQFTDPDKKRVVAPKPKNPDNSDSDSESSEEEDDVVKTAFDLDSDHRLLLQSVKPMFASLNRAVVLSAVSLYFHVAPQLELDICAKPLLRVLSGDADGHYVALITIQTILSSRSRAFTPYIRDFYLAPHDSLVTRQLRLRILARLTTKENLFNVVNEVKSYLTSYDYPKVVDAIRCLGLITYTVPDATPTVIKIILPLLSHRNEAVVTEAVVVLRQLVVQSGDKTQTCQIVLKLAHRVLKKEVTAASAKASIVWLVGENIRTHPNVAKIAPDMFRTFVKSFVQEDSAVKSQVILLGAKIWINLEGGGDLAERFKVMFYHLLELVKYDKDYDIRDQGRLVQTALDRTSTTFDALKTTLLAPRPLPQQSDSSRAGLHVGSASHVLGTVVNGYEDIAEWPTEQPDPTTRDPPKASSSSSSSSGDTSSDDDSDDSSSSSGDSSASSDAAPKGRRPAKKAASSSSDSSDEKTDSDSDNERGSSPKAPAAKPATKAIAAPVRVKIVSKVVAAKAPPRDRVTELFTPKPATPAAAPAQAHKDPNEPVAPTFVDVVTRHGVTVAYMVGPVVDDAHVTVRLRVTNQRDEVLSKVALADEHELGDRLISQSAPIEDIEPQAAAEFTVTLALGYPSVIVPLVLGDDDEELVPVAVNLPERA